MKKVKLDGKEYSIPTSWNDITVERFVRLYKASGDEVKFFAAMLDISEEDVMNCGEPDIDLKLIPQFTWYANKEEVKIGEPPKTITIEGKRIKIPKDLGFKTYGQKLAMTTFSEKVKDDMVELVPYVLAVYLYPEYTGEKFDEQKVLEFMNEVILKLKITKMYPIANFFLRSWFASINFRAKALQRITSQTSFPQG